MHQGEHWNVRSHLRNIFPYGFSTPIEHDRIELLVVPGIFALVQYHGQPNADSGVSVPIGYMTTEPERVEHLEKVFRSKIGDFKHLNSSWPSFMKANESAVSQGIIPESWTDKALFRKANRNRPILSLNK